MAVDTTIPNSSNNVGNDLSAIRENFELLASAQVVDEGSTADGDYIRYENGWQICIKREAEVDSRLSAEALEKSFDYPVDFYNIVFDSVVLSSGHSLNSQALDMSYTTGELQISSLYMRGDSTSSWDRVRLKNNIDAPFDEGDSVLVDLFAIGRWK